MVSAFISLMNRASAVARLSGLASASLNTAAASFIRPRSDPARGSTYWSRWQVNAVTSLRNHTERLRRLSLEQALDLRPVRAPEPLHPRERVGVERLDHRAIDRGGPELIDHPVVGGVRLERHRPQRLDQLGRVQVGDPAAELELDRVAARPRLVGLAGASAARQHEPERRDRPGVGGQRDQRDGDHELVVDEPDRDPGRALHERERRHREIGHVGAREQVLERPL